MKTLLTLAVNLFGGLTLASLGVMIICCLCALVINDVPPVLLGVAILAWFTYMVSAPIMALFGKIKTYWDNEEFRRGSMR